MNLSAYAQHKGVTVAAVKKAIESGRIKVTKKNGKYNIDSETADRQWAANSNAAKANHNTYVKRMNYALGMTDKLNVMNAKKLKKDLNKLLYGSK